MNGAWLRSIIFIFLLSTLTWAAAWLGVFIYWNASELKKLAEINGYALSSLVQFGDIRISIPVPAKHDSLKRVQEGSTQELKELEQRIALSQTAADSMDFEILLRQVKLGAFDSTDASIREKFAKENEAMVKQMAKIMASSPPETIGKISNGMDDPLLAKIVAASNNRDAARILGALAADRVAGVTRQLTKEKAVK